MLKEIRFCENNEQQSCSIHELTTLKAYSRHVLSSGRTNQASPTQSQSSHPPNQPHFHNHRPEKQSQMPPRLFRHVRPSVAAVVLPKIPNRLSILRWSSTTSKHHDPLRILFCGADAFSIYSLRALHELQQKRPDKIASIDVVCRPDKRVGRGLKKVQEG